MLSLNQIGNAQLMLDRPFYCACKLQFSDYSPTFLLSMYKKEFFFPSYDDIHRHSKIYYGIWLHSANVNCLCFFFRNRFVSVLSTQWTCFSLLSSVVLSRSVLCRCLVCSVWRWYTHIYMRISMYRFITHRKHTVANSGPLPMARSASCSHSPASSAHTHSLSFCL